MKTLWILTEERPKKAVIETIFTRFAKEKNIGFLSSGNIQIVPLINKNSFTFTYQVLGINTPKVSQILIKIVSGESSFVDYLVYFQENEPTPSDTPLFAIEETKTDDSESRNTGVFQRCTKFVYINLFYKNVKKIMLYSLQIDQKQIPTQTNIFGSKLLATYGVEVLGKSQNQDQITAFSSIDELIEFKNAMRLPPKGNVPILIYKSQDEIKISGRLVKSERLSHDPNIGALSIISAVLRKLGWDKKITIIQHGLEQKHISLKSARPNKFVQIATKLQIALENIILPDYQYQSDNFNYWHIEVKGEKLATIFIHLVVDAFSQGYSIFENHAGCEKSYFKKSDGTVIPLEKYSDRTKYKQGDKTAIIHIPDLILVDVENLEIINIEGKTYENRNKGILELNNYEFIENNYIKSSYKNYRIIRSLVLYGSSLVDNASLQIEVGFLLTQQGKMILGISAPKLFGEAIANLFDYWKNS